MEHRLSYVVRFPEDVERSLRFYRDALGLEVEHRDEGCAALAGEGTTAPALTTRDRLPELVPGEHCAAPPEGRHAGR